MTPREMSRQPVDQRRLADRRGKPDRRRQGDRRQIRLDALEAQLDPLRQTLKQNLEKIRELEAEQKVQLVRMSQIQREVDDLKKLLNRS